jgi:hypothetical protein
MSNVFPNSTFSQGEFRLSLQQVVLIWELIEGLDDRIDQSPDQESRI